MHDFIEKNKKYIVGLLVLLLFASNIIIWSEVFKKEREPDMRVSVFDVGQGDSIFINSKDGAQILIDGGPNRKVLSMLKDNMPYYDRSIDVVIATHPHKDHISGLIDVFKRYDIGTFIESGSIYNTSEYYELEKLIKNSKTRRIVIDRKSQILFSDGAKLKLLTPNNSFNNVALKNAHDADIVSELDFEGRKILMMGDAEKNIEKQLINNNLLTSVDALKVGHHGSKTSSIAEFLSVTKPKYSIISVGKNNYGHPNQDVLNRLTDVSSRILRTDIGGNIIIEIRSAALSVKSSK